MTTEERSVLCSLINQTVQQKYSYVGINMGGNIVPFKKYITNIKYSKYPSCKSIDCQMIHYGGQAYTEPI